MKLAGCWYYSTHKTVSEKYSVTYNLHPNMHTLILYSKRKSICEISSMSNLPVFVKQVSEKYSVTYNLHPNMHTLILYKRKRVSEMYSVTYNLYLNMHSSILYSWWKTVCEISSM